MANENSLSELEQEFNDKFAKIISEEARLLHKKIIINIQWLNELIAKIEHFDNQILLKNGKEFAYGINGERYELIKKAYKKQDLG